MTGKWQVEKDMDPKPHLWLVRPAWAAPASRMAQTLWHLHGLDPGSTLQPAEFPGRRKLPCSHGWKRKKPFTRNFTIRHFCRTGSAVPVDLISGISELQRKMNRGKICLRPGDYILLALNNIKHGLQGPSLDCSPALQHICGVSGPRNVSQSGEGYYAVRPVLARFSTSDRSALPGRVEAPICIEVDLHTSEG